VPYKALKHATTPSTETSVIRGQRTAVNDRTAGSAFFPSQLQVQVIADLTQQSRVIQMLPGGGVRASPTSPICGGQRKLLHVEKKSQQREWKKHALVHEFPYFTVSLKQAG